MKTKKRRLEYYSFYDHTGIEQHLTEMAKKGWLLENISNLYWTYRKIEPQDIHFCVTYYPRASDFDPGPSEDQQIFHDLCAHTGWQLACTWHQMQVFYNEKGSPIPLETDPIMEVDTLHRACKKNYLPSYYLLLVLGFLMGGYFIARTYFDPIGVLSSSSQLITGLAHLCLFAISIVELITYFTWYRKAKQAAQDGIFVDTPSTTRFQHFIILILLFGMIYWFANLFAADDPLLLWVAVIMFVYIFGVIFIVNGIKQGLKKAKASRGLNRALTLAACFILPTIMTGVIVYTGIAATQNNWIRRNLFDDSVIPLSVTDFHDVDEDKYIEQNSHNETFLLGQRVVHMFGDWNVKGFHDLPDLNYTITTVKVPFLYEWCKSQMYNNRDQTNSTEWAPGDWDIYVPQEASLWGAKEAYRLCNQNGWSYNIYLLCYEDQIVEIEFSWEPSIDDIAIVNHHLNQ